MALALADMNEALRLDPQNGDYYDERHYVYMNLAGMELYRVDQDYWWELAVADIKTAQRFGTTVDSTERDVAFTVLGAGHAEEALAMFNRIPPQTGLSLQSDELLQIGLGESYLALGQMEQALTHIERSHQLSPEEYKTRERAVALLSLDRLPEALDQLNQSINANPNFCGCRYYLRAYLYYLQGQPDRAQADIDVGTGQTWERGGLRSYVLGLLALDQGDQALGSQFLQEAEASLPRWYGPVLLAHMRQRLQYLGLPRLELAPYAPTIATAMPTPP
jgi:tetratricopeptide (TPR) repeat protein